MNRKMSHAYITVAALSLTLATSLHGNAQVEEGTPKPVLIIEHAVDKSIEGLNLGLIAYDAGDFGLAFDLLSASADLGDITARTRLGFMHERGEGTPKDLKSAYVQYGLAAGAGNPLATHRLERLKRRMSGRRELEAELELEKISSSLFSSSFAPGSNMRTNDELIEAQIQSGGIAEIEIIDGEVIYKSAPPTKSTANEPPILDVEEILEQTGGDRIVEYVPSPEVDLQLPEGLPQEIDDFELVGVVDLSGAHTPTIEDGTLPESAFAYRPGAGVPEIVQDILKVTGLLSRYGQMPVLGSPAVDNYGAVAVCDQYGCRIIFGTNALREFRRKGGVFAQYGIMAHEVGHHALGHLRSGRSGPSVELESDFFAGGALARLGAMRTESSAVAACCAPRQDSPSHPGRARRVTKMEQGWSANRNSVRDASIARAIRRDPNAQPSSGQSRRPVVQVTYARICRTPYGICRMIDRVPVGSPCYCMGAPGMGVAE